MVEEAKAAAPEMQGEIDDCFVEANWHGEVRQVIEDAARTGSGYSRAVSEEKTVKMYRDNGMSGS